VLTNVFNYLITLITRRKIAYIEKIWDHFKSGTCLGWAYLLSLINMTNLSIPYSLAISDNTNVVSTLYFFIEYILGEAV